MGCEGEGGWKERMVAKLRVAGSCGVAGCRRKCSCTTGTVNMFQTGTVLADVWYNPNDIQKAHFEFLYGGEVKESRAK